MAKVVSTAIVTGAGSGIGRATAERFIKEGWHVLLVGRRLELLRELEQRFTGKASALACDLTDLSQTTSLIERIKAFLSTGTHRIAALVNNAGTYERAAFLESDEIHWRRQFESNLLAPVRLTRMVVSLMTTGEDHSIVNVSSTLGLRPILGTAAYSASKAAMINWTQALALELASKKIRVNCICPGIVDTPIHGLGSLQAAEAQEARARMATFQPLGRVGRPEEIAHGIFHFCAPGSEWTTGAVLTVDGGINLV